MVNAALHFKLPSTIVLQNSDCTYFIMCKIGIKVSCLVICASLIRGGIMNSRFNMYTYRSIPCFFHKECKNDWFRILQILARPVRVSALWLNVSQSLATAVKGWTICLIISELNLSITEVEWMWHLNESEIHSTILNQAQHTTIQHSNHQKYKRRGTRYFVWKMHLQLICISRPGVQIMTFMTQMKEKNE